MSDLAIRVQNLSKQYKIVAGKRRHDTLRDQIMHGLRSAFTWNGWPGPKEETFWALKDVSFEVKQGEVVGIIGRNGAGKSTLLKILSRITDPTEGRADIYGRVGSLLEVGTGFDRELTGRENVYLNGAILGMRKAEIDRKFEEIVAFSEVEKFIDTPVKRYSSGMYVRLAFAVAAHLESEILIVDEVLAVGDAAFQKKCLGKIGQAANQGRAVLFVSHNVAAVVSLCSRCLLLAKGALLQDGIPSRVIPSYQSGSCSLMEDVQNLSMLEHYGTGKARFTSLTVTPLGADGTPRSALQVGDDLQIEMAIVAKQKIMEANVAAIIYDSSGYRVVDVNTASQGNFLNLEPRQEANVRFILHSLLLRPDTYLLGVWIGRRNVEDIDGITCVASFAVAINPMYTKHPHLFPGVYQCRYDHTISLHGAVAPSNMLPQSTT